jgi:hypothetical protein
MSNASRCPGCGAPVAPARERCTYCGQWMRVPDAKDQEQWLPAWTQGIASGGYSNGCYDVLEYPAMPLSQALQIVEKLPIPPRVQDPGSYCPPALGFGERQISRMEDGRYFLWPEDRACSLEEAGQVVLQIYGHA